LACGNQGARDRSRPSAAARLQIYLYPEETAMSGLEKVNRPIKWTADRSEAFCPTRTGAIMSRTPSLRSTRRQVLGMRVTTTARWARTFHVRVVHSDDPVPTLLPASNTTPVFIAK